MSKKTKELRQLSDAELSSRVVEAEKELMKLYSQVSAGTTPKKPLQIQVLKRTIACILTIKQQRTSSKDGGKTKA